MMQARDTLATTYSPHGTVKQSATDRLLIQHTPLVKKIAHHLKASLPPNVQLDDLIQAGLIGLLDAIQRFDDSQGAQFETYATLRIRGAIIDELRSNDWVSRSTRSHQKQLEKAISTLEHQLGRNPSDQELATHLSISLNDLQTLVHEATGSQLLYIEDLEMTEGGESFLDRYCHPDQNQQSSTMFDQLAEGQFFDALVHSIDTLPEREKLVMALYYQHEMNLKEIGEVLNVGESRVSQIHSQAVTRLRSKLKSWRE
jgi:RNA polymerase sigma factor for flagellar operon FliA